jgi:ammonia channel protein AmtB
MIDGITVSGSVVLLLSILFSVFSWSLFTWASKTFKVFGIPLSIISGVVFIIPFHDVLGPMTAIIFGIVAGFVAYMIQKYLRTSNNKSLIIALGVVAATYLVLTMMISIISPISHIWDMGYGGGTVDLDPELSPTYALDFMGGLFYHIVLPLTALSLGISALFLVPYFLLKRKNIPTKPYLSLILAGLLLYFEIPVFISSLQTFAMILSSQPEQIRTWVFNPQFIVLLIPIVALSIAGILLYRSSVLRKLIKK